MALGLLHAVICLLFISPVTNAAGGITKGYSIYNVRADNSEKIKLLETWRQMLGDEIDILSEQFLQRGLYTAQILLPPSAKYAFTSLLDKFGIQWKVVCDDVLQKLQSQIRLYSGSDSIYDNFLTFEQIEAHLARLVENHGDIIKIEHIGTTHEKRNISLVKIGKCAACPTIFIEAGIHAREWLSPAVALNIIDELINGEEGKSYISKLNWVILPMMNPDGYALSHNPEWRFWRKNRRPSNDPEQIGVDLNRNFDFQWATRIDKFRNGNTGYSDTYRGPSPASEPETKAVESFVTKHRNQIKAYVALHTFGQLVIYDCPWVNGTSDCSHVDPDMESIAVKMVEAMANAGGEKYRAGASGQILYQVTGSSIQWAKHVMDIPISYTIEMRPSAESGVGLMGLIGFAPRPTEIRPTSREMWVAFKVIADDLLAKYTQSTS